MSEPNRIYEQLVAERQVLPSGKVPLPIVAANLTYENRRYRIVVGRAASPSERRAALLDQLPARLRGMAEERFPEETGPRPRLSFTVEVSSTDTMGQTKWDVVRNSHTTQPLLYALLDTVLQRTLPFDGMPEPPPLVTAPDERPAVWDRLDQDEESMEKEAAEPEPAFIDGPFMMAEAKTQAVVRYHIGGPEDLTEG